MNDTTLLLSLTAASIGFFHTLAGPDHYLPFIVMSKAGNWTQRKTLWVTVLCGIGHVAGSVILGFVGIALGMMLGTMEMIEGIRGDIAAWALTTFGFVYFVWGVRVAIRTKEHIHPHTHADGTVHTHSHGHLHEHGHAHREGSGSSMTPWVLFLIFVLGPCEPLIPVLMVPAVEQSVASLLMVVVVFGTVTIGTMTAIVSLAIRGIDLLPVKKMERYTHALAGGAIALSGFAILFLGL